MSNELEISQIPTSLPKHLVGSIFMFNKKLSQIVTRYPFFVPNKQTQKNRKRMTTTKNTLIKGGSLIKKVMPIQFIADNFDD